MNGMTDDSAAAPSGGVRGAAKKPRSPAGSMKLAEIAAIAGVSEATVSRVLNRRYGVAQKTREQVEEKFFSCAERSIDKAAATKLFAFLNRFDQEHSLAEFWGLVKRA